MEKKNKPGRDEKLVKLQKFIFYGSACEELTDFIFAIISSTTSSNLASAEKQRQQFSPFKQILHEGAKFALSLVFIILKQQNFFDFEQSLSKHVLVKFKSVRTSDVIKRF